MYLFPLFDDTRDSGEDVCEGLMHKDEKFRNTAAISSYEVSSVSFIFTFQSPSIQSLESLLDLDIAGNTLLNPIPTYSERMNEVLIW